MKKSKETSWVNIRMSIDLLASDELIEKIKSKEELAQFILRNSFRNNTRVLWKGKLSTSRKFRYKNEQHSKIL